MRKFSKLLQEGSKIMQHSTNYLNIFIEIAMDCLFITGIIPFEKKIQN